MKGTFLIASAFVLSMASLAAVAQTVEQQAGLEPGAQPIVEPGAVPVVQEAVIETQQSNQILTTDLIGTEVMSRTQGPVGTLSGILFDQDDRIVGAVVSVGGFLGLGAKDVALSWDLFDVQPAENLTYVNVTPSELEAAPAFKDRYAIEAEQDAASAD